ncbi:hypothetical protein [Algoriphagus litoralis]|uniref:hypothetical protein n=1 Tax=Algoriphagus litoralis TaxID=2202829 RepID=UPI000DB96982|nr:hypothetical protein [Algoriphagus litoralis]
MKKTMFLALAVLGMVLGSFAVVQPVMAQSNCEYFGDDYGCSYALCGACLAWQCPGGPTEVLCTE